MRYREIEFRAWLEKDKKMITPYAFQLEESNALQVALAEWRGPFELMEFTGLLDKTNNMIYECDIVRATNTGNVGTVQYVPKTASFLVLWIDDGELYYEYLNNETCKKYFEVIGNIYENPEFLKGE